MVILIIILVLLAIFFIWQLFSPSHNSNKNTGNNYNSIDTNSCNVDKVSPIVKVLGETVPGKQYLISDYKFTNTYGFMWTIDYIYINQYGVWVILYKDYDGEIFGHEKRKDWHYYKYSKITRFNNPIDENYFKAYHLYKRLKMNVSLHDIVIFSDKSIIKNLHCKKLYSIDKLSSVVTHTNEKLLMSEEMEMIYNRIQNLN
ncbi:MAG: nuclease-related domain-containing protein [Christensenellales bacterium]